MPAVLAHQGGWDEALMLLVPMAVFWVILRAAATRHSANDGPANDGRDNQ